MSSEMACFDGTYITSYQWSVLTSYNIIILHCFQDIINYTVYVTNCNHDKSFTFNTTIEITDNAKCQV